MQIAGLSGLREWLPSAELNPYAHWAAPMKHPSRRLFLTIFASFELQDTVRLYTPD